MTKKERVQKAIGHEHTDIVPYNIELTSSELAKAAQYLGIKPEDFFDFAGNHIKKASYNIGGRYIKDGIFRDEFGVVWNRSGIDKDIGVVDEVLLKEAGLADYEFPKPDVDEIKKITEKFAGSGTDSFKFGKIGLSFFERAWSLRGMENLLMDFILAPAFVDELLAKILDYNMEIIEAAADYAIDGFYLGDDYGQQNGLLMSPQTWRRFIRPGLAKMFEKIKSEGKAVALHSCGNISEILGDLIDIGLDVYQTVQPEIYDLKKLKADYGRNITFWGAISTQQTLPFVKPAELKDIVRKTIDIMSYNGGYIAAPTHQVPDDVPAENIAALVEVLKGQ